MQSAIKRLFSLRGVFGFLYFFVQCNYHIALGVNFLPKIKGYFWFFSLDFLACVVKSVLVCL